MLYVDANFGPETNIKSINYEHDKREKGKEGCKKESLCEG